jgi:hypothetical protein
MKLGIATQPVTAWIAIPIACVIGLVYACDLLTIPVAFGESDYWLFPAGVAGGAIDMKTAMSGYFWAAQDGWRWPLFAIARANAPAGTNAALLDPVPILALAAKILHSITGETFDLMPFWVTAVFALNAAALTALVRALGQKTLLAAGVAAAIAALMPIVHFRFGHLGHSAHWIFVFALAIAVAAAAARRASLNQALLLLLLCGVAFASNLYLFVMTAAIAGAFFLDAWVRRSMPRAWAALGLVAVPAIGLLLFWGFGLAGSSGLTAVTIPFGEASMNLMSPFWPQSSGAFQWTGLYLLTRGSIGATRDQYEGFAYLGLGSLLLVGVALCLWWRGLPRLTIAHWPLALALLVLTVWAVSNRIYFGPYLIGSYPLPAILLETVLAWFRAEGRFFWPAAWLIAGLGIAGTLSRIRPATALALAAVAVALQWADLSLLRDRIHAVVTAPVHLALTDLKDATAIEADIGRAGRVVLVPPMDCLTTGGGDYDDPAAIAAAEVQLMAARANAVMPIIALARGHGDCATIRHAPLSALAANGVLIVLRQPAGGINRVAEALATPQCRPIRAGAVCEPDALPAR